MALPHTVIGAFTGTVVPLPEMGPLSLPLLSEPLLAEVALGPDPPALVPFPQEPPESPLSTVTELPHTVMGAFTATDVPFPEIGPLLLPLPEAVEPLELEACVPPLPTDTGWWTQVPLDSPLATDTELPQTVMGALTDTEVPLPDRGPLLLPLPFEPVDADAAVAPRKIRPAVKPKAPNTHRSQCFSESFISTPSARRTGRRPCTGTRQVTERAD
jgi:hypothetical protein